MFAGLFDKKSASEEEVSLGNTSLENARTGEVLPDSDEAAGVGELNQGSLLDLLGDVPAFKSDRAGVVPFPVSETQRDENEDSFLSAIGKVEAEADKRRRVEESARLAAKAELHLSADMERAYPTSKNNDEPDAGTSQSDQLDLLADELAAIKSKYGKPAVAEPIASHDGQSLNGQAAQNVPVYSQPAIMTRAINPFSFEKVVGAVLRAWWVILVCGVGGAVLGAGYALTLPNKYQSIAEILIEPRGLKVLNDTVTPNGLNSEATVAYAESQVRIINSSSVIDPVIEELELADDPEFNGRGGASSGLSKFVSLVFGRGNDRSEVMGNVKDYFYRNLYVTRINQTFTIQIGMSTTDPAKSARIVDAMARSYMADEAGARSSAARSATEDLTSRLAELRGKVRKSEQRVETYKAENGLVNADGKLVSEVQLARLNEQLTLAKVQTGDARTKAKQAKETDLADVVSGSLPGVLASPALSQLRVEYTRAKSRIAKLATKLGARHPDRIAGEAELRSARGAISQEIKRIVRSAQQEFSRARARQSDLQTQVNALKSDAVTDSAAKVELRALEREVVANRSVFESVLLRSRETGEQQNIQSKSARVISEATPAVDKEGPNRKLITALGGIIGGGFGTFLALVPFAIGGLRQVASGTREAAPGSPVFPQGDLYSSQFGSAVPVQSSNTVGSSPVSAVQTSPPQPYPMPPNQPAPGMQMPLPGVAGAPVYSPQMPVAPMPMMHGQQPFYPYPQQAFYTPYAPMMMAAPPTNTTPSKG